MGSVRWLERPNGWPLRLNNDRAGPGAAGLRQVPEEVIAGFISPPAASL